MTDFFETEGDQSDLLLESAFAAPNEQDLRAALARAEEARADERAKRLTAEATAQDLAGLIALENQRVVAEREARERAEADVADAECTMREMAKLVERHKLRADAAERRAAQSFCDDPYWPSPVQLTPRQRLLRALRLR